MEKVSIYLWLIILKVGGWDGALRGPGTSLQCLLECIVPHEQQRSASLPDFVCLKCDKPAILVFSRPISMVDY